MRYGPVWIGILLWACSSGCIYEMQDDCDDFMIGMRTRSMARRAWRQAEPVYDRTVEHERHFRKGFEAGYADVASGGNGCVPTLPPRHYWKACYQTPRGKEKTYAWFDGFTHGAIAAHQDGVAGWSRVAVSHAAFATPQVVHVPADPVPLDPVPPIPVVPVTADSPALLSPAP